MEPPVTSYAGLPARTWASVLFPEPLGPMTACTSPAFTVRSRPLRISLSPTTAWRSLISNIVVTCHPPAAQRRRDLLSLAVASGAKATSNVLQNVLLLGSYATITIDPSDASRRGDDYYPTEPSNVIPNNACAS